MNSTYEDVNAIRDRQLGLTITQTFVVWGRNQATVVEPENDLRDLGISELSSTDKDRDEFALAMPTPHVARIQRCK